MPEIIDSTTGETIPGAMETVEVPSPLDEMVRALRGPDGSLRLTYTFTHGRGVQVYEKTRKIGPIILPDCDKSQTLGDVLKMLGDLVEEE